jgi:hypothetical protein
LGNQPYLLSLQERLLSGRSWGAAWGKVLPSCAQEKFDEFEASPEALIIADGLNRLKKSMMLVGSKPMMIRA